MKFAVYICLFLFSFATLQPALSAINFGGSEMHCCLNGQCGETPMKSDTPEPLGCNPTMACASMGYIIPDNSTLAFLLPKNKRQIEIIDDNRIVSNSSDTWHPPRFES